MILQSIGQLRSEKQQYHDKKKVIVFLLPLTLLLFFIPNEIQAGSIPSVDFNGRILSFPYTDDNRDETLIVRTTQETYNGFNEVSVFTSIENISPFSQIVDLQVYFSRTTESMGSVFVLVEDVPFQIDVDDFGPVEYLCDTDFIDLGDNGDFQCERTGEIFQCDVLGRNSCTVNNEWLGTHQETRFEDRWIELQKTSPRDTQTQRELLSKTIRSEFTPREKASDLIIASATKFYRIDLIIPQNTFGEFYIEAIGSLGDYGLLDPFYNSDWGHRKAITINSGEVNATLTDFPILLNFTDTDLRDDAQTDGDDILFTNFDNTTKLSHEIERYNSTNGWLTAWVKIPSISSSTDTIIYMYYNNSAASNQEDITGTWRDEYAAVYHFNDDFLDSTSNSRDCTNNGTTDHPDEYIADSQDNAGSTAFLNCGSWNSGNIFHDITISYWFVEDSYGSGSDQDGIMRQTTSNSGDIVSEFHTNLCNSNESRDLTMIAINVNGDGTKRLDFLCSSTSSRIGNWNLAHAWYKQDSQSGEGFLNGTSVVTKASGMQTGFGGSAETMYMMGRSGNSDIPDGRHDEIRFYNGTLSDEWIDFEFCNQLATSFINTTDGDLECSAWSIHAEEEEGAGGNVEAFTDELGIEDSIIVVSNNIPFTDELGIEDSISVGVGFLISFTDELGIEDSIFIVSNNIFLTDEMGIEDAIIAVSNNIFFTDELGIEDILNLQSGNAISFTDEMGIEDLITINQGTIIAIVDELGIEDLILVSSGNTVNLIDELGIEDSITTQISVIYFTDELGIEDNISVIEPSATEFNAIFIRVADEVKSVMQINTMNHAMIDDHYWGFGLTNDHVSCNQRHGIIPVNMTLTRVTVMFNGINGNWDVDGEFRVIKNCIDTASFIPILNTTGNLVVQVLETNLDFDMGDKIAFQVDMNGTMTGNMRGISMYGHTR